MRKNLTKILLVFILGLALATLVAPHVLAFTETYKNFLNQAGRSGTYNTVAQSQDVYFDTTLGRIILTVISFTGLLFLVMTIYAGILWMTAGGNEEKITDAKKKIGHTLVGLAITLMAFIVTNTLWTYFNSRFLKTPDTGIETPVEPNP
ncbi:MAG: hypothetical protein WCV73_04380 [Patescibacteria group bacterium]|jgi:hypothetical protein